MGALTYAVAFIFFNVLLFILISAYGLEGVDIGTSGTNALNYDTNNTQMTASAPSVLSGFYTTISDLPWWLDVLLVTFEVSMGGLILYGLVRGNV